MYIANPAQPFRVGIAFPGIHDDNIITASGRRAYAPNSSDPMIRILNVTNLKIFSIVTWSQRMAIWFICQ